MSVTPHPDDSKSTDPALLDVVRWLAASRRRRNRRLALFAVVGIAFIAPIAAGLLFIERNEKTFAVSGGPPPSPRAVDKPSSPRPTPSETFAGREREHAVSTHDIAPRRPATVAAPAASLTSEASRRCSGLLERASLGETLTDDEQTFLRTDCR